MAGDPHSDLPGRSVNAILKTLVVRGPFDKVPDVQAEDAGVGIHRGPGSSDLAALGDHVGGRRGREGDSLGQASHGGCQGEGLLHGRHLFFAFLFHSSDPTTEGRDMFPK